MRVSRFRPRQPFRERAAVATRAAASTAVRARTMRRVVEVHLGWRVVVGGWPGSMGIL
jgi:hypothetical protein